MAIIFIRLLIMYILIFILLRLMGKRQIGDMQPFELVVTLMIAQVASEPIISVDTPLLHGFIPVVLLFFIESIVSFFSLKSKKFKKIVIGSPSVLIKNGKIDYKQMKKLRIDVEDIIELIRNSGEMELSGVRHLILETNGKASVITNQKSLPDILIADGKFIRDIKGKRGEITLKKLNHELRRVNINTISEIILAYEFDYKIYIFAKEELS
jgi:uncharacterized membrane protein YcaP (DUF421 family)